jgi:hypothetical protein
MPPQDQLSLSDFHANDGGGMNIYGRAIKELPSATAELASEAWQHPGQALGHAAKTVVEAGVMGTAIGYIVPARGPASIIVGVALTAPAAVHAYNRLADAKEQSRNPLADQQAIAHALARDTVSGTTNLGLSFAGGYAGAELGYAMAGSKGALGRFSQATQRGIMHVENKGMAAVRSMFEGTRVGPKGTVGSVVPGPIDIYANVPRTPGSSASEIVNAPRATTDAIARAVKPSIAPEHLPFGQRTLGILNRRVDQFVTADNTGYNLYRGPLHGHSRYSDGMGEPKTIYAKAKQEGLDFAAVTDHNHPAARGGVKPDDVRAKDQAGTPTVAEDPTLYTKTFEHAKAATDETFVGLVGVELGTIGKVGGHKHDDFLGPAVEGIVKPVEPLPPRPTDATGKPIGKPEGLLPNVKDPVGPVGRAPDQAPVEAPFSLGREPGRSGSTSTELADEAAAGKHLGGVNHINVLEVPTFLESVREPRGLMDDLIYRLTGREPAPVFKKPDVVKINDGDYRALVDHLDKIKDSTGGTPVIQLNHPRFKADESPSTPVGDRGRDYGQKSFKSQKEWLDRFADPYVRQIEVIKGGALTPDPVEVVPPGAVDATSFAGYLDKGVHASPTFGRDFHYGDPAGTPGTTMIMAKALDKPSLLDGLRERRTIATTNGDKLNATMWGNDKHPMGSILDQAAVPDLKLSANIGGEVVSGAEYKIKLWGDKKLGDKKLAEIVEEKVMTGDELIAAQNKVSFDALEHKLGNKSAYWMEIQRTDPVSGHTDRMFTAPIWVEPLTGDKHSFYMRWLTGNSAQFLDGLARGK